ncbi:MAG: hypothetical protein IIW17_06275 [Clostridia bacterium]|nr:hypothetical protein [Clostridia bacterium]
MKQDWASEYGLDVLIERQVWDISETQSIPVQIGLGYDPGDRGKDASAIVTVSAEGCLINGEQDAWSKTYDDFFVNDIYEAEVKNRLIKYDDLIPVYREPIEIVFPSGDVQGRIVIQITSSIQGDNRSTFEIAYIKNETAVVFYSQSAITGRYTFDNAKELLENAQ